MRIVGSVFLGLTAVGVLLALAVLVAALPDVARYLRMRRM